MYALNETTELRHIRSPVGILLFLNI